MRMIIVFISQLLYKSLNSIIPKVIRCILRKDGDEETALLYRDSFNDTKNCLIFLRLFNTAISFSAFSLLFFK